MGTSSQGEGSSRVFCTECGRPFAPEDLVAFGANRVCADCKPRFVQRLQEGAVTPTARVYGGFWRRFVALLLDGIILAAVAFPLQMILGLFAPVAYAHGVPTINWGIAGISYLLGVIIGCSYQAFFLSRKGATPGKMVMGMKVITPDGGPISVARAIGRYFAQILSGVTLCIGYLIAAFDSEKRTLHDHICSTRVVRHI